MPIKSANITEGQLKKKQIRLIKNRQNKICETDQPNLERSQIIKLIT